MKLVQKALLPIPLSEQEARDYYADPLVEGCGYVRFHEAVTNFLAKLGWGKKAAFVALSLLAVNGTSDDVPIILFGLMFRGAGECAAQRMNTFNAIISLAAKFLFEDSELPAGRLLRQSRLFLEEFKLDAFRSTFMEPHNCLVARGGQGFIDQRLQAGVDAGVHEEHSYLAAITVGRGGESRLSTNCYLPSPPPGRNRCGLQSGTAMGRPGQ